MELYPEEKIMAAKLLAVYEKWVENGRPGFDEVRPKEAAGSIPPPSPPPPSGGTAE